MKFELCTDTIEGALIADQHGFNSIELCSALFVGGLTPSYGLMERCAEQTGLQVHVMIRHREGDFICTPEDLLVMKKDIEAVKRAGAFGVVFGILDADHGVSEQNMELMIHAKKLGLATTFHRAFDFVQDPERAAQKIVHMGFDRLLTSGLSSRAEEGIEVLKWLQTNYGDVFQIIAGSGIHQKNARLIASSGIQYLHFTARKPDGGAIALGMGQAMATDVDKISSILNCF